METVSKGLCAVVVGLFSNMQKGENSVNLHTEVPVAAFELLLIGMLGFKDPNILG